MISTKALRQYDRKSTKTTFKGTSDNFEIYVEPLIPQWKKKCLEKRESLRKQLRAKRDSEKRIRKKMEKLEELDSDYLMYLKEREKRELRKFNWGICCYKCFCCWREKPAEAYFEYIPPLKISSEILEKYIKPYGVPRHVYQDMVQRAKVLGVDLAEQLGIGMDDVSICSCDPVGEMLFIPQDSKAPAQQKPTADPGGERRSISQVSQEPVQQQQTAGPIGEVRSVPHDSHAPVQQQPTADLSKKVASDCKTEKCTTCK